MLRQLWYPVLISTLLGGTVTVFSSPAAAAGVYTVVARCEIVRPGPIINSGGGITTDRRAATPPPYPADDVGVT
jgi:hypothetical protein